MFKPGMREQDGTGTFTRFCKQYKSEHCVGVGVETLCRPEASLRRICKVKPYARVCGRKMCKQTWQLEKWASLKKASPICSLSLSLTRVSRLGFSPLTSQVFLVFADSLGTH